MTGRHHYHQNHHHHHHHNQQQQHHHHHHHHHQHYYGYGSLGLALVACVVLSSAAAASATATGPGPGPGTGTSKRAAATGFSHTVRIPGSGVSYRREGGRPQPCTHLGDAVNAVSARAFSASTVFEGKARSRSPARRPPGLYAVTFVVQHVHKDGGASGGGALPLRPRSQVRLQFREKRPRSGEVTAGPQTCRQSYGASATPGELVRANIKRGGKYIVFVEGVGPHNFSVLGEPVFRTRKNLKAVREVLCPDCFRAASVSGLQNTTVKAQERLQLVCRCKGNPLPAISWYKNGQSINVSSSLRIVFKKKRSSLVIPRVGTEDGGRYECRATTVMGTFISSWATVTVLPHTSPPVTDNTTTLWPLYGVQCPIPEYCLNGGTCTYYETVGELVCQCADGFKGQRCESKDVYNRSSMYRPMSYFCKLGISSSYYC